MRPIRDTLNKDSLVMMGIPKQFCDKTMKDFKTYNDAGLKGVKKFVTDYINNIDENLESGHGIYFCGGNGVGKSFLSCLIMKEAYRHRYSCRRVTFSAYISAYTESWGASKNDREVSEQDLLDKYKGVEFLVLEEIGKEIDSKIAKPILEDLLRYREEHNLVTVICCNFELSEFKSYYGNSICSLINGTQTIIRIVAEDRRKDVFDGDL